MQISENVRSTVNQDGAILLDIEHNLMISLNVVGSKIWQRLQNGVSPHQVAVEIGKEFGLPPAQAQADVAAFVQDLCRYQLYI